MKKAKKVAISIVVIVCVAALLVGGGLLAKSKLRAGAFYTGNTDTSAQEGTVYYVDVGDGVTTPYLYKKLADGQLAEDFKILSTTDLHLHGENTEFTLKVLSNFIEKENPDLVVLDGDIIVNVCDTAIQEELKQFFEERNQYWAFVLGNHEGEGNSDNMDEESYRKWAFETLAGSPHCIARDEGGDDVYGYGNYAVNVIGPKGIVMQTLFFVDSGNYATEADCAELGIEFQEGYAAIKPNQLTWYAKRVAEITAANDGVTPKSIMFAHIPFKEMRDIYYATKDTFSSNLYSTFSGLADSDTDYKGKILYGDIWENICSAEYSSGMFDLICELGSTQAVIFGHDHVNGLAVEYKGVKLLYSQGLQYETYNRRTNDDKAFFAFWYFFDREACFYIDGVTIETIRADGTVDIAPKYAQYEGVFNGLESELKEVCGGRTTYYK